VLHKCKHIIIFTVIPITFIMLISKHDTNVERIGAADQVID